MTALYEFPLLVAPISLACPSCGGEAVFRTRHDKPLPVMRAGEAPGRAVADWSGELHCPACARRSPVIAHAELLQLLERQRAAVQGVVAVGLTQHLLDPELKQSGDCNQHLRVGDQIADPQLEAVEVVGTVGAVRSHRGPQVPDVVHGSSLDLLLGPGDEVLVIDKQWNAGRCERELKPALGMGPGDITIEEGGAGTQ